ncbi:MAG: hypothetical protein LBI02_03945 [Opitutaceae bacterium]|nr:hypothetical protein [Opitutaceae bacterium]
MQLKVVSVPESFLFPLSLSLSLSSGTNGDKEKDKEERGKIPALTSLWVALAEARPAAFRIARLRKRAQNGPLMARFSDYENITPASQEAR